jgi:hypothetical protein
MHSLLLRVPESTQGLLKTLLDTFLPAGYPHSVTEDYLSYVASYTRVIGAALTLINTSDIKSMYEQPYHTTVSERH